MIKERVSLNPDAPEVWLDVLAEPSDTPRDAMLVIAGGAYAHVCIDREGWAVAEAFLDRGMNCFVLNYRVGEGHRYPEQLLDAAMAMDYIRKNNKEYQHDKLRKYCTEKFSANVIIKKIINVYKEVIK